MAWQRPYDEFGLGSIVPGHDGGYVLVNSRHRTASSDVPVRVVAIDESGAIRQQRTIEPDVTREARQARTDLIKIDAGYAVATGPWFATLEEGLSVEKTSSAAGYEPNSTTRLAELPDGIAVASELDKPDHVSTKVFGFGNHGDLRWTRSYGEENSKWLKFLLASPNGGLVVGGSSGEPWLAGLEPDGQRQWQTSVTGAPSGTGDDATIDSDGSRSPATRGWSA